ncbi:MAG: amidohydrolase family protein [Alphaproteobacteria bacterium]
MPIEKFGNGGVVCLRGGRIVTFDDSDRIVENGELWICDKKIISVGPRGEYEPPKGPVEYVDVTGQLIIPGMINAHTHSYSSLLKGTVEKDPLDIYMLSVIASGSAMTAREIYIAAQLDALSMLRTGTTALIDHYSERPALSAEGLEAVRAAFTEIGIRATIATMFADRPYIETIPIERDTLPPEIVAEYNARTIPDVKAYFAVMESTLKSISTDERVRIILGVDGPQRCSDLLLEMTGDFQKRHHCGLHTHMLETKTQASMRPSEGPGFVRRLFDLGGLDEKSSLVHFIWADEDDIQAAKEAGVTVIHCPASNTMLGAGLSPILRLRENGIPIAYGTDGSNCGPPSLFETMRMGAYLMRLTEPDFELWPDARVILKEAYRAGAKAIGKPDEIGFLASGACADFTVMRPFNHWHLPMGDVYRHLLYYENGESVQDVWVEGRRIISEGRITTVDEEALLAEAQEIVARRRRSIPAKALSAVEAQYPFFRAMILRTLDSDIGIERRISLD